MAQDLGLDNETFADAAMAPRALPRDGLHRAAAKRPGVAAATLVGGIAGFASGIAGVGEAYFWHSPAVKPLTCQF